MRNAAIWAGTQKEAHIEKSIEAIIGYRIEDLLAQPDIVLTPEAAQALEETRRMFQQEQTGRIISYTLTLNLRHRNGSTVPIEFTAVCLYNGSGSPVEMIGIVRDCLCYNCPEFGRVAAGWDKLDGQGRHMMADLIEALVA